MKSTDSNKVFFEDEKIIVNCKAIFFEGERIPITSIKRITLAQEHIPFVTVFIPEHLLSSVLVLKLGPFKKKEIGRTSYASCIGTCVAHGRFSRNDPAYIDIARKSYSINSKNPIEALRSDPSVDQRALGMIEYHISQYKRLEQILEAIRQAMASI